jgi:hypothetical protein
MNWQQLREGTETIAHMGQLAERIRKRELDVGRPHYALTLSLGVASAIFCNVGKIVAIEFGVGRGGGLLDLCKAAAFFRKELDIEIDVYGLDNATGLPPPADYRDHPEFWKQGAFELNDPQALRAQLPPYAKLVIGDVADTTAMFKDILSEDSPLGFVSVDVDYYSSAMSSLEVMKFDATGYLPTVPMYFDDLMQDQVTSNDWCGEALAIRTFNAEDRPRKIQENSRFNTLRPKRPYHGCHILDHPFRSGSRATRKQFGFQKLTFY